ncbi:MAG: hypothetical protein JNN01_10345 [Opitutaceae bacterium]|nr:hypothetical protein [Opitutaceae bacterium]
MNSFLNRSVRRALILTGFALLCATCGVLVGKWIAGSFPRPAGVSASNVIAGLATLPLAFFLGIVLHEGGHLLVGKLLGGRFALVIVGPLRLMRTPAGLRLARNRRFALLGGLALVLPASTHHLRRFMVGLIAGGPLASLVFGLLLAGAAVLGWPGSDPDEVVGTFDLVLRMLVGSTGLFSLAFCVASSIPTRAGGFASDGARLLALARRGPAAEREALVFALSALSLSGMRARDLPSDLMLKAAAGEGEPQVAAAMQLLAYLWALDQGRVDAARDYLNQATRNLEALSPLIRDSFLAEMAYFKARYDQDVTGARASLEKAGRCELSEDTLLRAEAAVLLAEHRPAEAILRATEAIEACARSLVGAASQESLEWSAAIRDEARSELARTQSQ